MEHVPHEIENVDDADLDDHCRSVAVVDRLPLRASYRRRGVLALGPERALGVAPQVPDHLVLRLRSDTGCGPGTAGVERPREDERRDRLLLAVHGDGDLL